ncbi:hypothetical protein Pelo_14851 [Pelomyxa schiedti]|nr:hypothetical protein Pelo_14851 [Pelomyxa schiedti]
MISSCLWVLFASVGVLLHEHCVNERVGVVSEIVGFVFLGSSLVLSTGAFFWFVLPRCDEIIRRWKVMSAIGVLEFSLAWVVVKDPKTYWAAISSLGLIVFIHFTYYTACGVASLYSSHTKITATVLGALCLSSLFLPCAQYLKFTVLMVLLILLSEFIREETVDEEIQRILKSKLDDLDNTFRTMHTHLSSCRFFGKSIRETLDLLNSQIYDSWNELKKNDYSKPFFYWGTKWVRTKIHEVFWAYTIETILEDGQYLLVLFSVRLLWHKVWPLILPHMNWMFSPGVWVKRVDTTVITMVVQWWCSIFLTLTGFATFFLVFTSFFLALTQVGFILALLVRFSKLRVDALNKGMHDTFLACIKMCLNIIFIVFPLSVVRAIVAKLVNFTIAIHVLSFGVCFYVMEFLLDVDTPYAFWIVLTKAFWGVFTKFLDQTVFPVLPFFLLWFIVTWLMSIANDIEEKLFRYDCVLYHLSIQLLQLVFYAWIHCVGVTLANLTGAQQIVIVVHGVFVLNYLVQWVQSTTHSVTMSQPSILCQVFLRFDPLKR